MRMTGTSQTIDLMEYNIHKKTMFNSIYSQMPAIFVLTRIIIIKAQSHEVNKHVNRINITLTGLYTEFNDETNNK